MATRTDLTRGPGPHDTGAERGLASHLAAAEAVDELRARLSRYVELDDVPDELIARLRLVPNVFNVTSRRFEFLRTPNLYPSGRIVASGAGTTVTPLDQLAAFAGASQGGPFDVDPIDARLWRLLGGVIFASAAATVFIRPETGQKRIPAAAVLAGAGTQALTVPGNGLEAQVGVKRSFEVVLVAPAAVNVDLILWVAEEGKKEPRRSRVLIDAG